MVTKNLENLVAGLVQYSSQRNNPGIYVDVSGSHFSFAWNTYLRKPLIINNRELFTTNAAYQGISVGTGTTPPTKDDYQLENTITSGISGVVTLKQPSMEGIYTPGMLYKCTITNNRSEDITISEIGLKVDIYGTRYPEERSAGNKAMTVLLDRTVLTQPVTIPAGEVGVIDYKLTTELEAPKTISGVKIAGWQGGTDEEVAAMIDAAEQGTIDLQEDGGWQIGDQRIINVGAWTDAAGTVHAASDIIIAISSFDDYMSCGCVMQFDFVNPLPTGCTMSLSPYTNDYSASAMYTTNLPAIVEVLPDWLKTRLKTFDVEVYPSGTGAGSSAKIIVPNNKLALRSEYEVLNNTYMSPGAEGVYLRYYGGATFIRRKLLFNSSSYQFWWVRTPCTGYSDRFLRIGTDGSYYRGSASEPACVAPFGCL